MNKKPSYNVGYQIGEYIKKVDIYGHRVSVNANGQTEITSLIGGVVSLLVGIITLTYTLYRL